MSEISKTRLLKGYKDPVQVPLPQYGPDEFVTIYPLTDLQVSECESASMVGFNLDDLSEEALSSGDLKGLSIDAKAMIAGTAEGRRLAVSFSLKGSWTPAEVGQLPPEVVTVIYDEVAKISGLDKAAEVDLESFRNNSRGAGADHAPLDRDAVGADVGGADS